MACRAPSKNWEKGFLRHPANQELLRRLETGELSTMDFFRQLLCLVYRLLFLCSAEDRDLLFPPGVSFQIRQVYRWRRPFAGQG